LLYSLGLFDSLLQPSGDENVTSTELPESNETSIVKTITITSADFETALAGVEDAENLLESVGAIVPENDQQALRQQRDRAESLASEQKYDEAVSLLRQSLEQLETLRLTANRNVRFGSSSAGIERALQDCRDYYGAQNCPPEWYDEERARRVELKPFALSPTEVSFAEFAKFVDEQNHVTDAEREGSSLQLMSNHDLKQLVGYTWRQPEGAASTWENFRDNPVVHVSLEDAKAYCGWASARLPTRAEWEYAASGNTERLFADYFDKSTYSTEQADSANLASVPVNSSAIYDVKSKLFGITGNVWEWTSSIRGGSGEQYYVKGGSWKDAAIVNLRLTALRPEYPGDSYIDLGFRCVQDVERWP
jgi:formylglycine-generating enzyme required for sulfatase activity